MIAKVVLPNPHELQRILDARRRLGVGIIREDLFVRGRDRIAVPLRISWRIAIVDCCVEFATSTAAAKCIVGQWNTEKVCEVGYCYWTICPGAEAVDVWGDLLRTVSRDAMSIRSIPIVA
jgi:hypothetical protein